MCRVFRAVLVLVCSVCVRSGVAAEAVPIELAEIGIHERLGATLPLDLPLVDDHAQAVTLRSVLDPHKPAVVVFAYYGCPNLCGLLLNGAVESFANLSWRAGRDFPLIVVSIDPRETPALAHEVKQALLEKFGDTSVGNGWHFLTGTEEHVRAITQAAGFAYRWDDDQQQYAHSAGLFFVTPTGNVSRVLHNVIFRAQDLKLALVEAGEGKIGTMLDRLLLFCYHYDPKGRKYALLATNVMRAGAAATVVLLAGGVWWLRRGHGVQA